MTATDGESTLLSAFVTMTGALAAEHDEVATVQALVDTCKEALDIEAAGVLLVDAETGLLDLAASTDDVVQIVELVDFMDEAGPGVQAHRESRVVSVPDIARLPTRSAPFRDSALSVGLLAVHVMPLRLRSSTIGSVSLFRDRVGEPSGADRRAARALMDVATVGILHDRAVRESELLGRDLVEAVHSRVSIEQAKGMLAQAHDETIEEALLRMRAFAADQRVGIALVAARIVDRSLIL
jgi:GAF domain-containing protein